MGLHHGPRPGPPWKIGDEQVAEIVRKTLETKPDGATHWSTRTLAQATGLSRMTIQRIWRAFDLKPHRRKIFTLSTDPHFVDKVRDVVGLYLNPHDKALVLCVDEKSQVQALERTQPMLPLGLGYVEGYTHTYKRHGTTTLFAALDVASGQVLAQCKRKHRHTEFLEFLRHIDANVPKDLDAHLVLDNYATHKHAKVRIWLAARPRYHVHFVPTYSSWLNQVETWFHLISQRAILRDSFKSTGELIARIEQFVSHYNKNSTPFSWTATADSILEKVRRLAEHICGTED